MKTKKDSIKLISLAFILFIFFLIFVWVILYDFDRLASSTISKLDPGTTTSEEVKEKLGDPDQIKESGGKTEYLYDTDKEEFKNTIVLEGDKVQTAKEYVFDGSLGKLSDYKKKYGNPSLIMYDKDNDFLIWYIYLNEGLGVGGTDLDEVFELIHFEPQSESQFLQSTALLHGIVKEKQSQTEE